MAFCITRTDSDNGTLLQVDGQLDRSGLGELERSCREAQTPLTLDLGGLRHADETVLDALRRLESGGARLVGASQYLQLRLGTRPLGSFQPK